MKFFIVFFVCFYDDVCLYVFFIDVVVFTCSVCSFGRSSTFVNEYLFVCVSVGVLCVFFSSVLKNVLIFVCLFFIVVFVYVVSVFLFVVYFIVKLRASNVCFCMCVSLLFVMSW